MDRFTSLAGALSEQGVRYVVIGVWGASDYTPCGSVMFTTLDRDLFPPADSMNLLAAWHVCRHNGFEPSPAHGRAFGGLTAGHCMALRSAEGAFAV